MTFEELLRSRWSCRAFRDEELSDELLDDIFRVAQRTASWCNTQPWQVLLTRGAATKRFAESLSAHVRGNPPSPDLEMPAEYRGVYRDRRRGAGYALYASLGIDRQDMPAREAQMMRNYLFFGAPHVAVITTDRLQGTYGAIDCGGYVANVLTAARERGVATIPQAAIAVYSGHVREFFELPEDRLVVCAISLGYADESDPVNGFRTERAEVADAVTVVDR
ncbi:nitroreductase [Actinomycetospora endophytica]|uniref:Nitroreductase n=1 Tax=Actinomycetospora endophytica TaxID=2291215 RepID=A0ABS8PHA9_9PSEU|nr:nitroreductase [Actinomycetospora endophytica]MCD2197635.1 nitroreductase [Actinomycetospora endophytica]